jgi:ABC-type branched-subunit amino acid transport system substrate-binding protein
MPKVPKVSKRVSAGMALAVAATLAVTACGSSKSSSTGVTTSPTNGSSEASKALGAPVKIGVIGTFKTATFDSSSEIASAEAAARALNNAGGIAGHKVEIDVCNDQFNITAATACGRQMISDHVIAVTGNSIYDSGFQPLLAAAGIPIVGQFATSINAYTGKNEYLLTSGSLFDLYGATYYAAKHGTTKIYVSRSDVAVTAAIAATIKAAAAKGGYTYVGDGAIPTTVTDLSPYAQKFISSGATGVVLGYAAQVADPFVTTARSLGATTQKFIYTSGNLQQSDIAKLGPEASSFILAGGLPPLSATNIPGSCSSRSWPPRRHPGTQTQRSISRAHRR